MPTKCFLLLPTKQQRRSLRRYERAVGHSSCLDSKAGYHNAKGIIGIFTSDEPCSSGPIEGSEFGDQYPVTDGRWPTKCEACNYLFKDEDEWQIVHETLWVRQDTGKPVTLGDAPPGAMWDAYWMHDLHTGSDGKCMIVKLPNGNHWDIDGKASNCNRPKDGHNCWTRNGVPPDLTVSNEGDTCKVGAGSIGSGDYHGFLRSGVLT